MILSAYRGTDVRNGEFGIHDRPKQGHRIFPPSASELLAGEGCARAVRRENNFAIVEFALCRDSGNCEDDHK